MKYDERERRCNDFLKRSKIVFGMFRFVDWTRRFVRCSTDAKLSLDKVSRTSFVAAGPFDFRKCLNGEIVMERKARQRVKVRKDDEISSESSSKTNQR